jgi:RNase P subunit RPR2
LADVMNDHELRLRTLGPDISEDTTATLPIDGRSDRQARSRPSARKPLMNGNTMFSATVLSQSPICPKCRRLASLRLRERLREADGFPEVQCLECGACGEVVVVERGLGERTEVAQDAAVRLAA